MKNLINLGKVSILFLLMNSCSEESRIEGLLPTKPITIAINADVLKGTQKKINVNVENLLYTLDINYMYVQGGNNINYAVLLNNAANNVFIFKLNPTNQYVIPYESGQEINIESFKPNFSTVGYLVNAVQVNNVFTYTNTNSITMNNSYILPLKMKSSVDFSENFGWMQFNVSPEKITINKIVYIKNTNIKAGEE